MRCLQLSLWTCIGVALVAPWSSELRAEDARDVSLVRIIADPRAFDGVRVRLIGAFQFEREEQALYLNSEDRGILNELNAVWIDVPVTLVETAKGLSGKQVIVEGRIVAGEHGHLGGYAASVRDVTRLVRALRRDELRKGPVNR